ncbi:hypothetical protein ACLKA6_015502 [Drosophila palustris]
MIQFVSLVFSQIGKIAVNLSLEGCQSNDVALPQAVRTFDRGFEFLRLTELQQALKHGQPQPQPGGTSRDRPVGVSQFLQQWVASCLHSRCLSRCIQSLVADKELLDTYYQRDVAYLRHGGHATALFHSPLTAIQLDQSSLLSQLEPLHKRRHRRTCSQPNFTVMTQRLHVVPEEEHWPCRPQQQRNLLRRIKSLPSLYQSDVSMDAVGAGAGAASRRVRVLVQSQIRLRDEEATSVLDNFLPVNGRKLDKRHQPSLFEGVSMLDYNNCEAETEAANDSTTRHFGQPGDEPGAK